MTKHILRRFREGGMPAADEAVRTEAADLFATEDLQNAVQHLPRARRPRPRHVRGPLSRARRIGWLAAMTDFDAIAKGMTQAVPFAGYLGLEITEHRPRARRPPCCPSATS